MASKKTKPQTQSPAEPDRGSKQVALKLGPWIALAGVLLALAIVSFIRLRLLEMPLERDEGEYAYFGQLMLQGTPPYEAAYNMKLPGAAYFYALFMALFGQSPAGIHTGLLLTNIGSVLLLYFIGKKLRNTLVGAIAATSYALLSVSPGSLGFAAHATHFIVLCALAGFSALLFFVENGKIRWLVLAGLAFGLAFVVKQHAVFMMMFGLGYLFIQRKKLPGHSHLAAAKWAGILALSMAVPYLLVLGVAVATGTFSQFWHWTVEYAGQYVGIVSLEEAQRLFLDTFSRLSQSVMWFWVLGVLGLLTLVFQFKKMDNAGAILLFVASCALCVLPGFYFRAHYFIVFFPALALLVGLVFDALSFLLARLNLPALRYIPALVFVGAWLFSLLTQRLFFFDGDPRMLCAMTYGTANPFLESPEIAKFIAANTGPNDRIAVLGSEPQIYFYSKRRSATGYIYMYPLVEDQVYSAEMQREMIAEIERNNPKYLVYVDSPFSWLTSPNAPQEVFRWYQRYKTNFNLVGIIDMNPSLKATFVWRDQIAGYKGQGKNRVWVWERR